MRLNLYKDEHDAVMSESEKLNRLTGAYEEQVDRTAFKQLKARVNEYGTPIHETFPKDERVESFIMLQEGHRVTVRVSSEGGLVNLYIKTDLPEDVTESEALVRALVNVGREFGGSNTEVGYWRDGKTSIQMLWFT